MWFCFYVCPLYYTHDNTRTPMQYLKIVRSKITISKEIGYETAIDTLFLSRKRFARYCPPCSHVSLHKTYMAVSWHSFIKSLVNYWKEESWLENPLFPLRNTLLCMQGEWNLSAALEFAARREMPLNLLNIAVHYFPREREINVK